MEKNSTYDLVPSLKLCREIPDGEFCKSGWVWLYDTGLAPNAQPESEEDLRFFMIASRDTAEHWKRVYGEKFPPVYPAPTLEEIIAEFPYTDADTYICIRPGRCGSGGRFSVDLQLGFHDESVSLFNSRDTMFHKESLANVLLKLWSHVMEKYHDN